MWRQSIRDGDEELVARGVPDPVVDDLEAVEVEEEEGNFWSSRPAEDSLEPVSTQPAVG
jgi:hypothetical protein